MKMINPIKSSIIKSIVRTSLGLLVRHEGLGNLRVQAISSVGGRIPSPRVTPRCTAIGLGTNGL
jgi:hypothetical protein